MITLYLHLIKSLGKRVFFAKEILVGKKDFIARNVAKMEKGGAMLNNVLEIPTLVVIIYLHHITQIQRNVLFAKTRLVDLMDYFVHAYVSFYYGLPSNGP